MCLTIKRVKGINRITNVMARALQPIWFSTFISGARDVISFYYSIASRPYARLTLINVPYLTCRMSLGRLPSESGYLAIIIYPAELQG